MDTIRVIIADDHAIFRNGFKLLLRHQKNIVLCGEAESGNELLQLVKEHDPDLVFIDIQMPGMSGIEACRQIKEMNPDIKVIGLTSFNEDHYIIDMLQAGASGYLLKNTTKREVQEAMTSIFEGRMYYSAETLKKVTKLKAENKLHIGRKRALVKLSERELKIMELICKQLTNKEIAAELGLSVRTVESHRERIQEKVGALNTAGIVIYAMKNNLFPL